MKLRMSPRPAKRGMRSSECGITHLTPSSSPPEGRRRGWLRNAVTADSAVRASIRKKFPVFPGISTYFRLFPDNEEKKVRRRTTAKNRQKKPVKTEGFSNRRSK